MATHFPTSSSGRNELPQATLRFLVGWHEIQEGIIRPGGELIVWYDTERLPDCRLWWRDALVWDNEVSVCFHPGGQRYVSSTQKEIRYSSPGGAPGPVIGYESKPVSIAVPIDAMQVEMWFHSFLPWQVGGTSCDAWDSQFGQNYWYDVVRD